MVMRWTWALLAAALCGGAAGGDGALGDGDYAALKAAALARPRGFVYNTDGCDILYWPTNLPVSVENFTRRRLVHALGTRITTISYCPQSAGFGHFTCRKAGDPLTGTVTKEHHVLKRMARFLDRKSQRRCRLKFADTYYGEMTHYGLCRLAWADVRRARI